jgi:Fructose-2,6-bisphosphatase
MIRRDPDAVVLLLVRHGRTEANARGIFCGRSDVRLDAEGRAQAARLTPLRGRVDRVCASPLRRAQDTARAVGGPETLPGIVEIDQGIVEGMTVADAVAAHPEVAAWWSPESDAFTFPGGENLRQVEARVTAALHALARDCAPGEVALVVGHQAAFAAFACRALGLPLGQWRDVCLKNAHGRVARYAGGRFRLDPGVWSP